MSRMMRWMLWTNNKGYYNTVASSSRCFDFFMMQLVRCFMIVLLLTTLLLTFFIYFKMTPLYFNFWALAFATIATVYLFVGSGIEVC